MWIDQAVSGPLLPAAERRCVVKCKERLEAYLREQKVPYDVQEHATAYTAQEVAASESIPGKIVAKTVLVFADATLTMLVVPASYFVDLSRAAEALGVKDVRLAHEDEFATRFPDCELGAMPPFGNLYALPVYVDVSLAEDETIVFPAGSHTETLSMRYADFERLVKPQTVHFARPRVAYAP